MRKFGKGKNSIVIFPAHCLFYLLMFLMLPNILFPSENPGDRDSAETIFYDDFTRDLSKWKLYGREARSTAVSHTNDFSLHLSGTSINTVSYASAKFDNPWFAYTVEFAFYFPREAKFSDYIIYQSLAGNLPTDIAIYLKDDTYQISIQDREKEHFSQVRMEPERWYKFAVKRTDNKGDFLIELFINGKKEGTYIPLAKQPANQIGPLGDPSARVISGEGFYDEIKVMAYATASYSAGHLKRAEGLINLIENWLKTAGQIPDKPGFQQMQSEYSSIRKNLALAQQNHQKNLFKKSRQASEEIISQSLILKNTLQRESNKALHNEIQRLEELLQTNFSLHRPFLIRLLLEEAKDAQETSLPDYPKNKPDYAIACLRMVRDALNDRPLRFSGEKRFVPASFHKKEGGFTYHYEKAVEWGTYSFLPYGNFKNLEDYIKYLEVYAGYGFTYGGSSKLPEDSELAEKILQEYRKRKLKRFAHIGIRGLDYSEKDFKRYAEMVEKACKTDVDGVFLEEICWGSNSAGEFNRNVFKKKFGRELPYDPEFDVYVYTGKDVREFTVEKLQEFYRTLHSVTSKHNKILSVYTILGGWQGEYYAIPGLSSVQGHDYEKAARYVDISMPETYYTFVDMSPLMMFSVARCDPKNQGRLYPTYGTFDKPTPFNLSRGILYGFLGGVAGCTEFHFRHQADWYKEEWNPARQKVKRLFDYSYPGTVEVYFPKTGILFNSRLQDIFPFYSFSEFSGWYDTLEKLGFPVKLITEKELMNTDAEKLLGEIDCLVLPNTLSLSNEECGKITALLTEGMGVIATHKTSLYDEKGVFRNKFGLAFLPAYEEEVYAHKSLSKISGEQWPENSEHPVLDGKILTRMKLADVFSRQRPREGARSMSFAGAWVTKTGPEGNVLLSCSAGETEIPLLSAYEIGKGRVVYIAEKTGLHVQKLYMEQFGKVNDLYFPLHGIYDACLIPSVVKWATKPGSSVQVVNRPFGSEIYYLVHRQKNEKILVLLNFEFQKAAFTLKFPEKINTVQNLNPDISNAQVLKLEKNEDGSSVIFSIPEKSVDAFILQ